MVRRHWRHKFWYNSIYMKLEYARHGLQFFFITMVVAERRPVLSRIVGEKSRPELKPLGELVAAALRAVHQVWNAVTTSDFVIMPDHVHFLLIANYDCDRGVAPLFIAHRLADAIEMAAAEGFGSAVDGTDGGTSPRTPREKSLELVAHMAKLLNAAVVAANAAAPGELKVERGLRFGAVQTGGAGSDPPSVP